LTDGVCLQPDRSKSLVGQPYFFGEDDPETPPASVERVREACTRVASLSERDVHLLHSAALRAAGLPQPVLDVLDAWCVLHGVSTHVICGCLICVGYFERLLVMTGPPDALEALDVRARPRDLPSHIRAGDTSRRRPATRQRRLAREAGVG